MTTETPEETPIDLMQLRTFTDGDKDLEKECIGVFVKQSDKNVRVLSETCIDGKCDAWVEAAHMLKGGAAAIGALFLSELCGTAQYMPDTSAAERKATYDKIQAEYSRVIDYLKDTGAL